MAWTETTRRNYVRRTSGYASDVTDREWDFVAPFMPAPRRLGRPRKTDLRDVLSALLYIASTGCQWRMLPKDFPPCSTVQRYFYVSMNGGQWVFGHGSTITSSWRRGNWRGKKPRRQRARSTETAEMAAIALANKMARIAWKIMVSGETYKAKSASAAMTTAA